MRDAFGNLRPASELASLEAAARSRSEADWIVGMNATRAATIRLRSSFDGAVSLGRVQTPTLAILARREEEIRAFVPEPYWLVDATFADRRRPRRTRAASTPARKPRLKTRGRGAGDRRGLSRGQRGDDHQAREDERKRARAAALRPHLAAARRQPRFGFTARRTLAAAQRCYEEHKALTYPRTNSRYLTSDMVPEIKPIAALRRQARRVRRRPRRT